MSSTIWKATISRIGHETADFVAAGVYILFGEPVPPALADMAFVHNDAQPPTGDVQPGDRIHFGATELVVNEVGDIATKNLAELGHIVLYVDNQAQKLLPGAIKASSMELPNPQVGDVFEIVRP